MSSSAQVYRFGQFEVDLTSGELRRGGEKIKLQGKPFQVLAFLVEHPEQVATREDLRQRLWPADTFVDFDSGLNVAVRKLRLALGDSAEDPQILETLPRRGYRLRTMVEPIAQLREYSDFRDDVRAQAESTGQTNQSGIRPHRPQNAYISIGLVRSELLDLLRMFPQRGIAVSDPAPARRAAMRRAVIATGLGLTILVASALILSSFPHPATTSIPPQIAQLTHFGLAWRDSKIVTDGVRIYLTRREGSRFDIVQLPAGGGEPTAVSMPFTGATLYDISPDHSTLVVGAEPRWSGEHLPVWLLPVGGGAPRRLADVFASDAAWCANGPIVFAGPAGLYAIDGDGSTTRKLVDLSEEIQYLACSPLGRTLRFAVTDSKTGTRSIWQVSVNGLALHEVVNLWHPDAGPSEGEFGGAWTANAANYVFASTHDGQPSLWGIHEKTGRWLPRKASPVRLYGGPVAFVAVAADPISNRMFAIGDQPENRDLVRFSATTKRLEPYLSGLSARWLRFSPDGRWIAYVNTPDYTLWRSRADGTGRLQLTFAPFAAFTPVWSPDGNQLAFAGSAPGRPTRIYVISRDGGAAEPSSAENEQEWDPNWSADGKTLFFGRMSLSYGSGSTGIYELDLKTKDIALLPGSDAFTKPALSPDGRSLAAFTAGGTELVLFDFRAKRWTKLAGGTGLLNVFWSPNGRYIYFQDFQRGREQPIFRVGIQDRRVEQVLSRDQLLRGYVRSFALTGLTPAESLLVTVVSGKADVYAFTRTFDNSEQH